MAKYERDIVIIGAARTPVGSFNASLASVSAPTLGGIAIKAALQRSKVPPEDVDEVIMGCVLPGGLGQAPARQAMHKAGLPWSVAAMTINKVCGSGLKAVGLGVQAILSGDAEVVLAGGMESMSGAPYFLPGARQGFRMGNVNCIDLMIHDGLWDPYNNCHMGVFAEKLASEYGYTRAELDEFAAESYRRALKAQEEGIFSEEIVPVEVTDKKGNVTVIDQDEEPKRVDFAKMPKLKPAFKSDGVITAANASSINDGAAAVVITTPERAKKYGSEILGYVVGQATASQPPEWFTTAPVASIEKLLQKIGWKKEDVDLWEINEAFSDVTLHAIRTLGLDHKKVNIYGGAVAIGHPIGASGARILVTLLYAMKRLDVKRGVASLCIGGGEAISMAIERR